MNTALIENFAEESGLAEAIDVNTYPDRMEKFAELIIWECIAQCADNGSTDEWDKGVRWAANQIKEHFGATE